MAEQEKPKGPSIASTVAMVTAGLLIFGLFAALSGCLDQLKFGQAKDVAVNACSFGFTTAMLAVTGWWLGIMGTFFDYMLLLLVTSMGGILGKCEDVASQACLGNSIRTGWIIIRNLVNLAFIGTLIYAAVSQILGINKDIGKTVVKIILAALLVNFSFFFAGTIIDASNFVTSKIYGEAIYGGDPAKLSQLNPFASGTSFEEVAESSPVSSRFMVVTKLGSVYALKADDFEQGGMDFIQYFVLALAGGLLFSSAAAIFAVGAVFLLIRFVVIIILLITSPLGILHFAGIIVPGVSEWSKAWWNTLFAQALFPVVYVLLIGIALKIMEEGISPLVIGSTTFFDLVTKSDGNAFYTNINLILVFLISYAFLFFALRAASSIAQQQAVTPPTPAAFFAGAQQLQKLVSTINPRNLVYRGTAAAIKTPLEWTGKGITAGYKGIEEGLDYVDRLNPLRSDTLWRGGGREARVKKLREQELLNIANLDLSDPDTYKRALEIWKNSPEEMREKMAKKAKTRKQRDNYDRLDAGIPPAKKTEPEKQSTKPSAGGGDETKKSASAGSSGGSDSTTRASATASFTAVDQRLASLEQAFREGNQSLARSVQDLTDIETKDLFQEAMLQRTEIFADSSNTKKLVEALGEQRFNKTVAEFPANKFSAQVADAITPHLDEIGYSILRTRKDFAPVQHKTLDDSMARNNPSVMASAKSIRPDIK